MGGVKWEMGPLDPSLANPILSARTVVSPARWIFTNPPAENIASVMLLEVDLELACLLQVRFSES